MCLKCSFEVSATSQFFVRQFWQLLVNHVHCSIKAWLFCGKVLKVTSDYAWKNHLLYYPLDLSTKCFNLTFSTRCDYTRGAWQFFNGTWPYMWVLPHSKGEINKLTAATLWEDNSYELTAGQNSMHILEVHNFKPYVFRVTILADVRPFKIRALTLWHL